MAVSYKTLYKQHEYMNTIFRAVFFLCSIAQKHSTMVSAIIIGAGPSGIAMAHKLKQSLGFDNFMVCGMVTCSPVAGSLMID